MVFKIEMDKVSLTDVGVGISVPKGASAEIVINGMTMVRGRALVEEREEISLVEQLGLPIGTPQEKLIEAIKALHAYPYANGGQRSEILQKSDLWSFIERSANATTTIQAIVALAAATLF